MIGGIVASAVESKMTSGAVIGWIVVVVVVVASGREGRGGEGVVGCRVDVFLREKSQFRKLTGVSRMTTDRLTRGVWQSHSKHRQTQSIFGLEKKGKNM